MNGKVFDEKLLYDVFVVQRTLGLGSLEEALRGMELRTLISKGYIFTGRYIQGLREANITEFDQEITNRYAEFDERYSKEITEKR